MINRRVSLVLKIAIFATGCAGIVAEFVLSTLATYLVGNAVFQWTMVMSLMLFAMGLGSRLSKSFSKDLLDLFIIIEFCLSILCASSAVIAYGLFGYTSYTDLIIYITAMTIGGLIGFEIPVVTRLNEAYEELRYNIAEVMEKDYYGSLLGGLFFAFFALPYLGLTYTPIILGTINFAVASVLLFFFFKLVKRKKLVTAAFACTAIYLTGLAVLANPIIMFGEQKQYMDKVIYAEQTPYQKIVMTRFKDYYWLYINGQEQFATFDEERYHEPLVHPAMMLSNTKDKVLILGGGDGLALREIFKHDGVESVTMVDLDPAMTRLAVKHPILLDINEGSMLDKRLKVVNQDAAAFLKEDNTLYSVIIIDLPDPDTIDLMHLYSLSFYRLLARHLKEDGAMVTQATSPYFSQKAFLCILKTIREAGFNAIPYHNQIPTMGEWGWVLATKQNGLTQDKIKKRLMSLNFNNIPSKFINNDAVVSILHFGKGSISPQILKELSVNTKLNPVLHKYYRTGAWAMY